MEPWRRAISKLREQLEEQCLIRRAELRRFQRQRLVENLFVEIGKSRDSKATDIVMSYWLFCGSPWQNQLGYNHAQDQHFAELRELGWQPQFRPGRDFDATANELSWRLDSLASWIEAEEGLILWRALYNNPAAWDVDDPVARRQALDAELIAKLPTLTKQVSDWASARLIESLGQWTRPQWTKVLKAATNSAGQPEKHLTELESWVWWRYPIFSRYHWSAAEAFRAALEKFGEIPELKNEAAFQSTWVRRGLRFTGSRKARRRPPFWKFVINEDVPKDANLGRSMVIWIPYEKSSRAT